jgi:hypothetical protein
MFFFYYRLPQTRSTCWLLFKINLTKVIQYHTLFLNKFFLVAVKPWSFTLIYYFI